jgi:hypothetical protein
LEATSEERESLAEHEEVPKEEAAVKFLKHWRRCMETDI